MSEAAGGGRADMERRIVQSSLEDESFRHRLLADPRAALEEELGTRLPEEVRLVALEETADTVYLVLPLRSTEAPEADELSDRELEAVSGGASVGYPSITDDLEVCPQPPATSDC